MKKLFLDWGRAPVVLYVNDVGLPRAAFMRNDPYNAWMSVNPMQVWEEARPLDRREWNAKFKHLLGGRLPKAKDFDPDKLYRDDDPWYSVDYVPEDDPMEPLIKAEESVERPIAERLEWQGDEIEIYQD